MKVLLKLSYAAIAIGLYPSTPEPRTLVMKIINRCNFRCRYCFTKIYGNKEIQGSLGLVMDISDFTKVLTEGRELKCKKVEITGLGEPSIHPDFYDCLSRAKDLGYAVVVTTNGWDLDPSRLGMLDERDRVQYSVDRMHLEGSPDQGAYIGRVRPLLDGARARSYSLLVKMHGESTPEIDALVKDTGVRVVRYPLTKGYGKEIKRKKGRMGLKCVYPWYTLTVSPDLKVDPCCSAHGHALDDLKTGKSLKGVWYGDALNAFRRQIMSKDMPAVCRVCPRAYRGVPDWLKAYFQTRRDILLNKIQ